MWDEKTNHQLQTRTRDHSTDFYDYLCDIIIFLDVSITDYI